MNSPDLSRHKRQREYPRAYGLEDTDPLEQAAHPSPVGRASRLAQQDKRVEVITFR